MPGENCGPVRSQDPHRQEIAPLQHMVHVHALDPKAGLQPHLMHTFGDLVPHILRINNK